MISLGQKYDQSPCCPPERADRMSYPSLYFTCDKEYEIPEEGTATIKFRKVEDSENTRNPEDPKYRYELEVHGIDIVGLKTEKEDDGADVKTGIKEGIKKLVKSKSGDDY